MIESCTAGNATLPIAAIPGASPTSAVLIVSMSVDRERVDESQDERTDWLVQPADAHPTSLRSAQAPPTAAGQRRHTSTSEQPVLSEGSGRRSEREGAATRRGPTATVEPPRACDKMAVRDSQRSAMPSSTPRGAG